MTLSDDESDYIDLVRDRAIQQIDCGIWEGIQRDRLNGWLGSLKNLDAELLAAYLLDNLCYRSRDQYSAMLDTLLLSLTTRFGQQTLQVIDVLKNSKSATPTCGIRFAPVIGHLAPPTKSGPYILRLAQRRFRINNDWLIWPHLIKTTEGITDIYFIDDFCGTGQQFDEFMQGINFNEFHKQHPSINVTYLVTTIHEKGLHKINSEYPYVNIKWAELLEASHAVLEASGLDRYKVDGFSNKILQQYDHVLRNTNLPRRGKLKAGFGQLSLAYAFAHATPNNTLPIFWMGTPQLTPLLDR